jgi:dihydroflavonol-4-reductase
MKILVTGAGGLIGSHIVEELSKQGIPLRAAYRASQHQASDSESEFMIDGLETEAIALNVNDRNAVFQAVKDCQMVFHAENLCSFDSGDKGLLQAINVEGTKNIMEASLHHGVERVVYTSGMETLRAAPGQDTIRETDGVSLEELKTDFERSRFLAEREAIHFKQKGLPLVIVHPTVCLGTRDYEPTIFGNYLIRYLRGKTHFYLDTGLNLVDVVDVAKGHLLAAKRGQIGGRYILGNQNVYMLELLRNLEAISGVAAPTTALPFSFAKLGNGLVQGLLRRRGGLPTPLIELLRRPLFFDSTLAKEELGMPQSNVWEAMRRHLIDVKTTLGI